MGDIESVDDPLTSENTMIPNNNNNLNSPYVSYVESQDETATYIPATTTGYQSQHNSITSTITPRINSQYNQEFQTHHNINGHQSLPPNHHNQYTNTSTASTNMYQRKPRYGNTNNGYTKLSFSDCGSYYYCAVICFLSILFFISSLTLSRVSVNHPNIEIINLPGHSVKSYGTTQHGYNQNLVSRNVEDPIDKYKAIASSIDPREIEDIEENLSATDKFQNLYEVPTFSVCLFKKKGSASPRLNWSKKDICNELVNVDSIYNIYGPTKHSLLFYKLLHACGEYKIEDMKFTSYTNSDTQRILWALDKKKQPSIGISTPDLIREYVDQRAAESLIVDGKSCFEHGYFTESENYIIFNNNDSNKLLK